MVFFLLAGHRANPTPSGLGVSDSLIFPAHDLYQNHVYKPGCPGAYPPVLFTCLNTDYHLHCYPSACQSPPLLLPQSSYKKPLLVSNHIRYRDGNPVLASQVPANSRAVLASQATLDDILHARGFHLGHCSSAA